MNSARLVPTAQVNEVEPGKSVRLVGVANAVDGQRFYLDSVLVDLQECPRVKIEVGEPYMVIGEVYIVVEAEYTHSVTARICRKLNLTSFSLHQYTTRLFAELT